MRGNGVAGCDGSCATCVTGGEETRLSPKLCAGGSFHVILCAERGWVVCILLYIKCSLCVVRTNKYGALAPVYMVVMHAPELVPCSIFMSATVWKGK